MYFDSIQDMLIDSIPVMGDIKQNKLVYLTRLNDGVPFSFTPRQNVINTSPLSIFGHAIQTHVYMYMGRTDQEW